MIYYNQGEFKYENIFKLISFLFQFTLCSTCRCIYTGGRSKKEIGIAMIISIASIIGVVFVWLI